MQQTVSRLGICRSPCLRRVASHLESVLDAVRLGRDDAFWITRSRDGRLASTYPVVTPLLVTPLYVPAWLYLRARGWTQERLVNLGPLMEKLAASLVASATAGLLFLVLRRRLERRDALLLAGAFAFGTNTWMTSSQGLWQHGPGQLFVAVALLAVTGPPSWWNVVIAGIATGLLPSNRPSDLLLALGFGLYALFWARRRFPLFAVVGAVPMLLTLAYNLSMFNNPSGGYGVIGAAQSSFFEGSLLVGIAGLLVSPSKGLIVFSPFLLSLPVLFRRSVADCRYRTLTLCLALAIVLQLLLYARTDWRAGFSWGPRFLTDMLPLLIWMLSPIVASLRGWSRRIFVAAAVFAVMVQALGAFYYQGRSDLLIYRGSGDPRLLAWRPEHAPFWADLQSGLAPMEFLTLFRVWWRGS